MDKYMDCEACCIDLFAFLLGCTFQFVPTSRTEEIGIFENIDHIKRVSDVSYSNLALMPLYWLLRVPNSPRETPWSTYMVPYGPLCPFCLFEPYSLPPLARPFSFSS